MDLENSSIKKVLTYKSVKETFLDFMKKHILVLFSVVGTSIAFTFYSIGYLFSYGYYFSGETTSIDSLQEILINPIPFDFKPIIILGIVFLIAASLFSLLVKAIKKNFFIAILIWTGVHVVLYTFFVGFGGNIENIAFFAFVWVLPILVFGMVKYFKTITSTPILIFSGLCYSILALWITVAISMTLNINENLTSWGYLLFMAIYLFSPQLLQKVILSGNVTKIFYALFYPISASVFLLILNVLRYFLKYSNTSLYSILLQAFTLILALIVLLIFKKPLLRKIEKKLLYNNIVKESISSNTMEMFISLYKNKYITAIVMITSILFIALTVSYSALIMGHSVRMATLNSPRELIKYNFAGKTKEVLGKVVAKKDGIYYISNQNFKLIVVKTNELETTNILSIKDLLYSDYQNEWLDHVELIDFSFFQLDDDPEWEIIIYKNQKLLIIDRDNSGITNSMYLSNIKNIDIKDNAIKLIRNIKDKDGKETDVTELYKVENKTFKKIP